MTIGCSYQYDARLVKRGVVLDSQSAQIQRIEWERAVDTISTAQVTFVTAGDNCCGQLGLVDHEDTDLVILSDGIVRWRGPVMRAAYGRGYTRVEAKDMLAWLTMRVIREDRTYDDEDLSDIFVEIWNESVASIDPPVHDLVVQKSGVRETRQVRRQEFRLAWNVVREMLDTGLDVTTFGSRIMVGQHQQEPIILTMDDIQGDVEIVKDGDAFRNFIYTDAADDITGIYPDGDPRGSNGYPLVEYVNVDSQIPDVESATRASQSMYDFAARGIRRVRANGGLVLLPSRDLDYRDIIAGRPVTFTANETCYTQTETLRLGSMRVVAEAGVDRVEINLQPLGSRTEGEGTL